MNISEKQLGTIQKIAIIVLAVVVIADNVIIFGKFDFLSKEQPDLNVNEQKLIDGIESYLNQISKEYVSDVRALANKYKIRSWGCGPSSYALAKIIDKKFFNNTLGIDASYGNHPIELVLRFGFALSSNGNGGDHTWLELYVKNKMLFIDPTVGQFGKGDTIAYKEFDLGDPGIGSYLKDHYNIIDDRLSLVVRKYINRIPASQEPYPGISIDPADADYYIAVLNARNEVESGQEPVDWKEWVTTLTEKYK